jgi:cytochrome P450
VEKIAEIAVVVAASWPAIRACSSAPYRRANPRATLFAGGALAATAAVTGAAALAPPVALRSLAALAAIAALAAWWRSRPGFGRDRGLPPGRLTLLPPLAAVRDPGFLLEQWAAHGPVLKIGGLRHPVACVFGLDRGLDLLQRYDAALEPPALPFNREIARGFVRYQGREDHARYRRTLGRALSRDLVDRSAPAFERTMRGALAAMAGQCGRAPGGAIPPLPSLRAAVFACLAECLLGVPPDDERYPALLAEYRHLDQHKALALFAARGRRAIAAIGALTGRPTRRCMLSEIIAAAPEAADDPTILGNVVYMASIGTVDVADLLRWAVKMLGDNPSWQDRLRTECGHSATGGRNDMAYRITMETLRLAQSELINRVATRDMEVGGYVIPRGWVVRICVRESHRDPAVFPGPERFDPDRFRAGRPPLTAFMPFGANRHACLGEHLTVAIAASFLTALADGYDLAIASDGPVEMGPFHWRPSDRFRVRVAARNGAPA